MTLDLGTVPTYENDCQPYDLGHSYISATDTIACAEDLPVKINELNNI